MFFLFNIKIHELPTTNYYFPVDKTIFSNKTTGNIQSFVFIYNKLRQVADKRINAFGVIMRFVTDTYLKLFYANCLIGTLIATFPLPANADELTSALNMKMKYLSQNQSVISKNLANAHTPAYKALELKEPEYSKDNSHHIALKTTSPMHISTAGSLGVNFKTTKQKDTYETAPNGNNVSIEEQMLKMSKNNTQHQEVTALAKKFNNLIAVAAGGN